MATAKKQKKRERRLPLFKDEETPTARKSALQTVRSILNWYASPEGLDMMEDKGYSGASVFTAVMADLLEEVEKQQLGLAIQLLCHAWLRWTAQNGNQLREQGRHDRHYNLFKAIDAAYKEEFDRLRADARGSKP
jgi:hypothetical protein